MKIELLLHSVAIKGEANYWVFASNGTFESFQLLHLLVHSEFLAVLIRTQEFSAGASTPFRPVAILRLPKVALC